MTNTPLDMVETAGGYTNGGKDKTGLHGVSQQNYANLVKGYADATTTPDPQWLTNDFNVSCWMTLTLTVSRWGPPRSRR